MIQLKDFRKRTLLHIAAIRGNVKIVKFLVNIHREFGVNVDPKDRNGDTPLYLACVYGFGSDENEIYIEEDSTETNSPTGEKKLESKNEKEEKQDEDKDEGKDKDEDKEDEEKLPELSEPDSSHPSQPAKAAKRSQWRTTPRFEIVRLLLLEGAEIRRREGLNSPLHWAIYWADADLSKLLYEFYPNQVTWTNSENLIPFDICLLSPRNKTTGMQGILIVEELLDDIMQDSACMIKRFMGVDIYEDNKDKDIENPAGFGNAINFINTMVGETMKFNDSVFSFISPMNIREAENNLINETKRLHPDWSEEEVYKYHNMNKNWAARRQDIIYKDCFLIREEAIEKITKDMNEGLDENLIDKYIKQKVRNKLDEINKENFKILKSWNFNKREYLKIIDHRYTFKHNNDPKKFTTYNLQKIIHWFSFFQRAQDFYNIMKYFNVSPFVKNELRRNVVHQLCIDQKPDMLYFVLNCAEYQYIDTDEKPNFKKIIEMQSGYNFNTCIHYTILFPNFKCYQIIKQKVEAENKEIDIENVNFRGWPAISLIKNDSKFVQEKNRIVDEHLEELLSLEGVKGLHSTKKELESLDTDYQYAIIAYDDCPDDGLDKNSIKRAEKTTVYKQLINIKKNPDYQITKYDLKNYNNLYQKNDDDDDDAPIVPGQEKEQQVNPNNRKMHKGEFKSNIKIKYFEGFTNNDNTEDNYFIYLIKIHPIILHRIADSMDFQVYDFKNRYQTTFISEHFRNFEPLREIQIHQIILHMIMNEFDIRAFNKQGLVLDYFPMHKFRERRNIAEFWSKYYFRTLVDPIIPSRSPYGITPLTQVAFYHGIQHGFYIAFLVNYTSWLIVACIPGIIYNLYSLIWSETGYDHQYLSILAIFIALWVTVMLESWKRRQNSLAYLWGMNGVEKETPKIFDYNVKLILSLGKIYNWSSDKRCRKI